MAIISGGSGGSRSTSKPVASAPKTYYFNGRTYTSYEAYYAAKVAYEQAVANRLASEQQARLERQQKASAAEAAARKAVELRAAQARSADSLRLQAQADEQRRKQIEIDRRKAAWAEIARKQAELQHRREVLAEQQRQRVAEFNRTRELRSRDLTDALRSTQVDQATKMRLRRYGEEVSLGDLDRQKLLEKARATGDYKSVFDKVAADQKATGGRYVDADLYEGASDEFWTAAEKAKDGYIPLYEQLKAAVEDEDWARAREIFEDPKYAEAEAEYTKYYGSGREPGMAQQVAQAQAIIAQQQDQFIARTVFANYDQGRRLLSDQELDERWGEFRERHLLDRGSGPGGFTEFAERGRAISITEFLDRTEARERATLADDYRRAQANMRQTRHEGILTGVDDEGKPVYVAQSAADRQRRVEGTFLGKGGISEPRYRELIQNLETGTGIQREEARRTLMNEGVRIWTERNADLLAKISSKAIGGQYRSTASAQAGMRARMEAIDRFRRQLFRDLTGDDMDTGIGGVFQRLNDQPVSGDVLRLLGAPAGAVGAGVRLGAAAFGSRLQLPDVQLDALFGSGNDLLSVRNAAGERIGAFGPVFDTSDEAKAQEKAALADLMGSIGDENKPLGERIAAIVQYGNDFAGGNTSILAGGLIDPLTFLSAGRFLRAGNLATVRAGGLRAARMAPGATLKDFIRLSFPESRFSGVSVAEVAELADRIGLARDLKRNVDAVSNLPDAQVERLALEAARHTPENAPAGSGLRRLYETDPIAAQQIHAAVIADLSAKVSRTVDARDAADMADYARRSLQQADLEAEDFERIFEIHRQLEASAGEVQRVRDKTVPRYQIGTNTKGDFVPKRDRIYAGINDPRVVRYIDEDGNLHLGKTPGLYESRRGAQSHSMALPEHVPGKHGVGMVVELDANIFASGSLHRGPNGFLQLADEADVVIPKGRFRLLNTKRRMASLRRLADRQKAIRKAKFSEVVDEALKFRAYELGLAGDMAQDAAVSARHIDDMTPEMSRRGAQLTPAEEQLERLLADPDAPDLVAKVEGAQARLDQAIDDMDVITKAQVRREAVKAKSRQRKRNSAGKARGRDAINRAMQGGPEAQPVWSMRGRALNPEFLTGQFKARYIRASKRAERAKADLDEATASLARHREAVAAQADELRKQIEAEGGPTQVAQRATKKRIGANVARTPQRAVIGEFDPTTGANKTTRTARREVSGSEADLTMLTGSAFPEQALFARDLARRWSSASVQYKHTFATHILKKARLSSSRLAELRKLQAEGKPLPKGVTITGADAFPSDGLRTYADVDRWLRDLGERFDETFDVERPVRLGNLEPGPKAPDLSKEPTKTVKGRRSKLVKDFVGQLDQRRRVAREAAEAADILDKSRDRGERLAAFDRLETLVAKLRELNDIEIVDPESGATSVEKGIITRQREALADFDSREGFSDKPPMWTDVTLERNEIDTKYTRELLTQAKDRLKGAASEGQARYWAGRIKSLQRALDYFELERRVTFGTKRTVARLMKRYAAEAAEAIGLHKIAPRALTKRGLQDDLARELRQRFWKSKVEDTGGALRGKAREQYQAVADDIATMELPRNEAFDALEGQFGAVDQLDLAYAIRNANRWQVADDVADVVRAVRNQLDVSIKRLGGKGGFAQMDTFWNWHARHSLNRRAVMTLRQYRAADEAVAEAIRRAREWQAQGGIFLRSGKASTDAGVFVLRDRHFLEIYAKAAALKKLGWSIEEYETTRTVLRAPNQRYARGRGLLNEARVEVANNGGDLGEVFDRLREARRMKEIERNLELEASRPEMVGLDDAQVFAVFKAKHLDRDVKPFVQRPLNDYQERVLHGAYHELTGLDPGDLAGARERLALKSDYAPPFEAGRQAIRDWLVAMGEWAPRTAESIARGDTVWSIDNERRFYEARWGWTPPWTDPAELLPILRDPDLYRQKMAEWGFLNDDFEIIARSADLTVQDLRGEIVFGGPDVKRARTYSEVRRWFVERYGRLVSDDGVVLKEVPWLMDPRKEYAGWIERVLKDGYRNPAVFQREGLTIHPSLLKPGQIDAFAAAVRQAVDRRLTRLIDEGKIDADETWLPQEQTLFAYEVIDALLAHPSWRGVFERKPGVARALDAWSTLFRTLVTWVPAFPIMNLLDAYGMKRFLLSALHNGFRPLSRISADAKAAVPDLVSIGAERNATWYVRGRNGFVNAFDKDVPLSNGWRAREFARGFAEIPLRVSKFGEDRLRLDFARSQWDRQYHLLREAGIAEDVAKARALAHSRRMVDHFFPDMEGASNFIKVLNQVVPFFSYNLRTKLIGVEMALANPWVLLTIERLGDFTEEMNREWWENEHPGVPFPAGEAWTRQLLILVDGTPYTIDLGSFSDWTRGMGVLFETHDVAGWLGEFLRVPHPSQLIFFAAVFGFNDGKSPWGTPVDLSDISLWGDLIEYMGANGFDPNDPRAKDQLQILSQMLFYKGFGRLSPMKVKVQQFFGFMALDEDRAWQYYNDNPDLAAYFLMDGTPHRVTAREQKFSWWRDRSQAEIDAFDAAQAEYKLLRDSFDARLDELYLTPWDPEYRDLKKKRRAMLAGFLLEHPVLPEAWGFWRSSQQWATIMDEWVTDDLVDQYFAMDDTRPKLADYDSELDFALAERAWFDARQAFLEAHPAVYERLHHADTAVGELWNQQELMWSEEMSFATDVKIAILREDAKPDADRDLINFLHDVRGQAYNRIDAESFAELYDLLDVDRKRLGGRIRLPGFLSESLGRIKSTITLPGRADFFYAQATPEERLEIEADERYFSDIGSFMDKLSDPKTFWSDLDANPALRDEYLRRNPNKRVDYDFAMAMRAVFNAGGALKFWDNLVANPALLQQYLERNPEKRANYRRFLDGRRYYTEIQALFARSGAENFYTELEKNAWLRDQYYMRHPEKAGSSEYRAKISELFRLSSSGADFFARLEADPELRAEYFRRNPEKAAAQAAGKEYATWLSRWVQALEAGNSVAAKQVWDAMPAWVKERYYSKHPEGERVVDGADYAAAMGEWVNLLKAKRYDEAKAFWEALPSEFRERYYDRHPDQRARNELDLAALAAAAEYFVATPGDRLTVLERNPELRAWLLEHGGKEAEYRGLVAAAYRAVPDGSEWLKRKFRDAYPEVFSKQAIGERRIAKVSRTLVEHPEMRPFYERALALQQETFVKQYRLSGVPPKPLTMERKRRLRKRGRRRSARLSSHYRLHRRLRTTV